MNYQTFLPHPDLQSLVKCYWILEIPADHNSEKQRIVPDGCIEMAFILGDDIKRFTYGDDFILQPRAMVIGQITEPFYIQPCGYVNTFAVRFYPFGFGNFVTSSIAQLVNKETPINELFDQRVARDIEQQIIASKDTQQRIAIIEEFLLQQLNSEATIDNIVTTTIDALIASNGNTTINSILKEDLSKRRQLERKFLSQIGMSMKQLGKVIRLQAALKMLLSRTGESLTEIAYENDYYDQSHFIKDFKEFTGTSPREFLDDKQVKLSTLFYTKS